MVTVWASGCSTRARGGTSSGLLRIGGVSLLLRPGSQLDAWLPMWLKMPPIRPVIRNRPSAWPNCCVNS